MINYRTQEKGHTLHVGCSVQSLYQERTLHTNSYLDIYCLKLRTLFLMIQMKKVSTIHVETVMGSSKEKEEEEEEKSQNHRARVCSIAWRPLAPSWRQN